MNFKSILKPILKAADFGAKVNVPVLSEIDRIADTVKAIKGRRSVDTEAVNTVLAGLQELKTISSEVKDKGALQSKKFRALIAGLVAVYLAPHVGLSEQEVAQVIEGVIWMVGGYVLAQGAHDAVKAMK